MPSSASRLRRTVAAVTAAALAASTVLPPALPAALAQPLPDLGDVAQVNFTPVQERKLGEAIMRQARAQGGVFNDPEVNDYLNELGNRLVAASPDTKQDFDFFAVADNGINAFALPGGYIGVNTGLILLTQSESELAAVLAHEITHVTQRHLARMLQSQQSSMLMSLAALAVALLAARAGSASSGDMASAALATGQALSMQNQLNFTREFEFEADRIGFQRLAAAGFDVRAAATFMDRMQKANRFMETNAPSYLRTHPITYERVAEATARAQAIPYRQVPDSLDYHLVRALLRSYLGDAQEAVRFFQEAIKERKYNSQVAAQYGLVASYLRARNGPAAKQALAVLEKDAPPHPMIDAMAAHVMLENGEVAAATLRIETALQKYPNKMQLVYDYPEALIRGGRYEEAAKFCESQLLRFNGDGRLHRVAAQAYAGLQRPVRQHYHQGEYYAWLGNLRAAVDQLQLASKMGDGTFYDTSVIETRLRALRREIAEQQKEGFGRQQG
jgi:predicted Zn-dependent protease